MSDDNEEFDPKRFWRSLPAFAYFWLYWRFKSIARRMLHIGALAYLSASFLFLVAEVGLEIAGNTEIISWLHTAKTPRSVLILELVFIIATIIIFSHHLKELRHRRAEYMLGDSIWALLEGRGLPDEASIIKFSLPLVERAFTQFGVRCVCIWKPTENGMIVPDGWAHPVSADEILTSLPKDVGIANAVFNSKRAHYVPRMGFPFNSQPLNWLSWKFPNAIILDIIKEIDLLPEVKAEKILRKKVYVTDSWRSDRCRSFLVVPLFSNENSALGVMSIDFTRTDAIGISQMKTAVSMATLIAEELSRVRQP